MQTAHGAIASAFVVILCGCTTPNDDDDYSDSAWSQATDDGAPAELEDASQNEDVTDPPLATDDTDDLTEPDDIVDPASIAAGATYHNPISQNCADPGVIQTVDKTGAAVFYAACTGNGFPLFRSTDLVHWTGAGHLFKVATKPKWGAKKWWAPEIHAVDGRFVLYFAALSPARGRMCIGAATADTIEGTWTDLGHPLVCDAHNGLIDPNVHADGNGNNFLYCKTDGNSQKPAKPTIIYGQQLGPQGTGFRGVRHRLLVNNLPWEGAIVEAPWVMQRGKFVYMFYSGAAFCNGRYSVGVARATSMLGPFHKRSAPILHTDETWTGPGHNAIVFTGGHAFIVYAAWPNKHECEGPNNTGQRDLLLDRIEWHGGWPSINDGTPSSGPRPAP